MLSNPEVIKESSPNVVTSMLQLFSFNVYSLFDIGATFLVVTPLVTMKFDIRLDILD